MKHTSKQTIAIVGASGFLGSHLTRILLEQTSHSIVAISRRGSLPNGTHTNPRVQPVAASVLDEARLTEALQGCDVAFYFVHMMGQKNPDFYGQEALAAERFSAACKIAKVRRVVFMGGLGDDREDLSEHLLSRHNTGTVLRQHLPLVIEFRASMIIGNGSLAYDIVRNLIRRLPIMILPKWSVSKTQPIALSDVLLYLVGSIDVSVKQSEIFEIGGPDILSYADFYRRYSLWAGTPRRTFRMTLIPDWLGGSWLNLFTPRYHAKVGKVMVHSLRNSMVVRNDENTKRHFPDIQPVSLDEAFAQTLRHPKV